MKKIINSIVVYALLSNFKYYVSSQTITDKNVDKVEHVHNFHKKLPNPNYDMFPEFLIGNRNNMAAYLKSTTVTSNERFRDTDTRDVSSHDYSCSYSSNSIDNSYQCGHPRVTKELLPLNQPDKKKDLWKVTKNRQSFHVSSLRPQTTTRSGAHYNKDYKVEFSKLWTIAGIVHNPLKDPTNAFQLMYDRHGKVHFLNRKTTKQKNL